MHANSPFRSNRSGTFVGTAAIGWRCSTDSASRVATRSIQATPHGHSHIVAPCPLDDALRQFAVVVVFIIIEILIVEVIVVDESFLDIEVIVLVIKHIVFEIVIQFILIYWLVLIFRQHRLRLSS
jgi:hypothetical protein